MAKKYTKPADKTAAAIGGLSIKFDDHNEEISGFGEVHYETTDSEAHGQPEITLFDDLTTAQQTLVQNLFDSIRSKASKDTALLERNTE